MNPKRPTTPSWLLSEEERLRDAVLGAPQPPPPPRNKWIVRLVTFIFSWKGAQLLSIIVTVLLGMMYWSTLKNLLGDIQNISNQ